MERAADWCILRTSGGRTLKLARSLGEAGFDVWTPQRVVTRRKPRSQATTDIDTPIMPTFVFARADRLHDIARVLALPLNPHPGFSIFRHMGRIPLISDRDVLGLRQEEEKAQLVVLKKQRHVFPIGGSVQVPEGAFAGLTGIVEGGDGKFALVAFGGSFRVQIATFLLRTDDVPAEQARLGIAA